MAHDRMMDDKAESGTENGAKGASGADRRPRHRASAADEAPPRDGRAARAVRTRKAVADALLDLITEGDLRPTSKCIAARAGVSERTIFQHFEDLETLFSAAADRLGNRIVRNLRHISEEGPLEERLSKYLDEIVYLHEAMTPVRRASRLHEPFSPVLDDSLEDWRETLRRGIDRVFMQELAQWGGDERRFVLESLAVVASWSSWENMRRNSEFSKEQARRVLTMSFRALLRQPPAAEPSADPDCLP